MPEAAIQPTRVVDVLGPTDPVSIGPFRLLGRLGSGGMGRVYLGQSAAGRLVAVKVIREEWAEDAMFRRRFARELGAARTVSPLYTAAVIAAEPDADPPWFATTYIDGPSLARQVGAAGPLRTPAVLTLAAGLAEALSSMHGVGLVHRDLKPSNVLLSTAGPHVIDFGIALPAGATRLTSTMVVGTPAYLAPERLDGDEDSSPGDIFSLGSTLYYACTGRSLLGSGTMEVQLARLARAKFDLSGMPRTIRPIATRCLARAPKDRPTATELVHLLIASGAQPATEDWYTRPVAARHNAFEPARRGSRGPSIEAGRSRPAIEAPRVRPALESGPSAKLRRTPTVVDAAAAWLLPRRRLVAYGALAVATVAGVGWLLRGENRPGTLVEPPVSQARLRWHHEAEGQQSPLVIPTDGGAGDLIIEASRNEVRASQAGGNRVAWARPAEQPVVLGSGWPRTVIVAERGRYSAVGATDGLQRFEVPASAPGAAVIPTANALVLVGRGEFIAVNQTGGRLTGAALGNGLAAFTAISAAGNLIFVALGSSSPSVAAIDLSGRQLWLWSPTDALTAAGGVINPGKIHTLLADRNRVYVLAEHSLTALDRSGKPLWAIPAAPVGASRPANSLDRPDAPDGEAVDLLLVEEKDTLSARAAGTGDLLWQMPAGTQERALALNPSGDTAYVSRGGYLDVLAADTGHISRRIQLPEEMRRWRPSAAAVTSDTAYLHFAVENGRGSEVYAIAL